jgi:hypothetical protein
MNTDKLSYGEMMHAQLNGYTKVRMRGGKVFLRKSRGQIKPIKLNKAFAENASLLQVCAPAASRIKRALHYYLHDLVPGYLGAKMASSLRKGFKEEGKLDIKWIKGMDLQDSHPLSKRLRTDYVVRSDKDTIGVEIPIDGSTVRKINPHEEKFYFELVLLYGDCGKDNHLRIMDCRSEIWSYKQYREDAKPVNTLLSLSKPHEGEPWVLLLKVSVLLDDPLDEHPMNHGVKVIASYADKFE